MYDVTITRNAQRELDKMPATLIAALIEAVDELGIYGAALQDPEVRYVGHGIRELRVCSPEGFGRAFYFFMKGRRIYIVHILHKKTAKTPRQDLELALQRMKTIKRNEM
ncbi:type II toxin-antitoxin system RelE/ParE family toxin [Rahnella inusitata]|uniref:type II toxin-antitoxin system RelE/ParE family toxin n=1 Tax=Rahnella inusitata TaxID=58169 RepID=UPI0039B02A7B